MELGDYIRILRKRWWIIVAALVGVAFIVRPSGEMRPDALVGVMGAVLASLAYIAVRRLSRTEHPLTIMLWFPLATVPPSLQSRQPAPNLGLLVVVAGSSMALVVYAHLASVVAGSEDRWSV